MPDGTTKKHLHTLFSAEASSKTEIGTGGVSTRGGDSNSPLASLCAFLPCLHASCVLTPPPTRVKTRVYDLHTGTPPQEHCALPDYVEFKPQPPVDLGAVLSAASPDAMDLLLRLLVLRPDKRATAREALRHPFFTKHEPKPCDPSELALPIPEERKHKVSTYRMVLRAWRVRWPLRLESWGLGPFSYFAFSAFEFNGLSASDVWSLF